MHRIAMIIAALFVVGFIEAITDGICDRERIQEDYRVGIRELVLPRSGETEAVNSSQY